MRNTQLIRWTKYICRMLDGRSRKTSDFIDLIGNLNKKALYRDLEGLVSVAELQIVTWTHRGNTYWRMDAKLVPDPITRIKQKYCPRCDKTKPIEEFYFQRGMADGRKSTCCLCSSAAKRAWAKENRKHINAYRRRRRKSAIRRGVQV